MRKQDLAEKKVKIVHAALCFAVSAALVISSSFANFAASPEFVHGGFSAGAVSYAETDDPVPDSASAILYESTTGTVVFSKNADEVRPLASMTKVMTAIVVLERNPELEGTLTVDERAVDPYYCSSMTPLKHLLAGEIISYEDCMRYMLIPSGNDGATSFAFEIAGSVEAFAEMMNEEARKIGCKNTTFRDPHGISPEDKTTAEDMVKIAEYAMRFEKFRQIVKCTSGSVPPSNKREKGFDYENSNELLYTSSQYDNPYSEYVTGVKTGWTPSAGYCLTCCMEKDGLVWYSVVMGVPDSAVAPDGTFFRGDTVETLSLLDIADSTSLKDLRAIRFRKFIPAAAAIAAAVVVLAVIVYRKRHRREM